jgi:hypothetical protein
MSKETAVAAPVPPKQGFAEPGELHLMLHGVAVDVRYRYLQRVAETENGQWQETALRLLSADFTPAELAAQAAHTAAIDEKAARASEARKPKVKRRTVAPEALQPPAPQPIPPTTPPAPRVAPGQKAPATSGSVKAPPKAVRWWQKPTA